MGQHSRSLNAQTAVQQLGLDKVELALSPSSAQMSKSHHHGQAYYPPQDQQSAPPHPVNQINSDNACHVLLHPFITNIQVEMFHTRHCPTTLPGPLPNWSLKYKTKLVAHRVPHSPRTLSITTALSLYLPNQLPQTRRSNW